MWRAARSASEGRNVTCDSVWHFAWVLKRRTIKRSQLRKGGNSVEHCWVEFNNVLICYMCNGASSIAVEGHQQTQLSQSKPQTSVAGFAVQAKLQ